MHATTSPKIIDQQPAAWAILAAVVLGIGIALGAVMDIDLRIASAPAAVAAPDTSYNAVEGARAQFGVNADTSYDVVEGARAQFGVNVVTSYEGARARLGNGDASYDAVEGARAQFGVKDGEQATQPDRDGRYGHGHR